MYDGVDSPRRSRVYERLQELSARSYTSKKTPATCGQKGVDMFWMDTIYLPVRLCGLLESPTALMIGRSSKAFKIYGAVLCVISCAGSIRGIHNALFTTEQQASAQVNQALNYSRYVYAIVMSAASAIRISAFYCFNSSCILNRMSQAYCCVMANRELFSAMRLGPWPHVFFHLVSAGLITTYLGMGAAMIIQYFPGGYSSVDAYIITMLNFVNVTSYAYGFGIAILVTECTILPVLRKTTTIFERAVRHKDANEFREAVNCHDLSLGIIGAVDIMIRWLIGMSLSMAVPLFALVCTYLTVDSTSDIPFQLKLSLYVWIASALFNAIVSVGLASRVYVEAEKPGEIVRHVNFDNEELERYARVFLQRFQGNNIGYTFFGFATVTKTTMLTVFGLMTNYYIVGIQLADI